MNDFLERRAIGRTGLTTGRLGIGATFDAPARVIEDAFERGVNYLYWGTVRQPGFAQAMVNLAKRQRDELIFTIQSYSQDPASIEGEVEEALLGHDGVLECAVVGRPHPDWGEEVVAFVVAKPGATVRKTDLDRLCLERIARFKRPRAYRFVDAIPKNNYGKVLKTELREMAVR